MANSLGIELKDRVIILNQAYFKKGLMNTDHPFICLGGFGCNSQTKGGSIGGHFISDGEKTCIRGSDVMRLATEKEIGKATKTTPYQEVKHD